MKQFACKSCGSIDLFTKEKGGNSMLYCSDCGAYQQNLNKNDKLLFEEYKKSLEPIMKVANNIQAMDNILNYDGSIVAEINNLIVSEKARLEFVNNSFQRGIIKGLEMALKLIEGSK